jgi:two-component system sensor histidine kinase ChvG
MTDALYTPHRGDRELRRRRRARAQEPLTSLRSAVETLPLAKSDDSRGRLLAVIQHDVKRLDRLISDISDASRLDAEMQRTTRSRSIWRLLNTWSTWPTSARRRRDRELTFEAAAPAPSSCSARFPAGQVIDNLIDNARSFSPPAARCASPAGAEDELEIVVDDDGPG